MTDGELHVGIQSRNKDVSDQEFLLAEVGGVSVSPSLKRVVFELCYWLCFNTLKHAHFLSFFITVHE